MPRTIHQMKFCVRPGAVQVPGGFGRGGHVVTPLHDGAGNARQLVCVAYQLALFELTGMYEEMVFDAGKGQREVVGRVLGCVGSVWQ